MKNAKLRLQDYIVANSYRTIVSDGNLCGLETREGPWARDPPEAPPRGGGYYIDDPDPFWTPVFMNFKPVF